MIIKELKKIVFSKIIIALLISLCIVNVLYETRTIIETKEQIEAREELQKEKIDNYSQFLSKIKEDGINMQSFSLFAENNKFQVENAKKTVEAYEAVKDVRPVYGNYKVIEKITDFGLVDIILFVLVVQIALTLISHEMKNGILKLLKSCKNGRINLAVNKMVAMAIMTAGVMMIVYSIKFFQLYIKYGLDNLMVPIQSVRGFYECSLPIEIWQYMMLYFLLKWITLCIIGIAVIGVISLVKNEVITYGLILIGTSLALLVSGGIQWNMSTAILKMLSPATLLNTKSFTAQYMNINVFQKPLELFKWTLIIMLFYLFAGVVFGIFSFLIKKGVTTPKINVLRMDNKRKIITKGIMSYEQKKIFLINKVIIFVIIIIAIQGYFISNNNTKLNYHDKCYIQYISKVYGVPDEDSQNYLDTEQQRFDEIEEGYTRLTEQFIKGEVDAETFALAGIEYNNQMKPYDDFKKVQQKNQYLKELKNNQNIEGWFTNDLAFDYIFDNNKIYDKNISFLILFVVAVFCIVPVFTYDKQKEMLKLLDTTYHGRNKLVINKYMSAIIISIILWLIETVPWLCIILKAYTPDGLMAPAQSLMYLENFPLHISILGAMILFYICKCIGMILLGLLVVGISNCTDDYVKNISIAAGIIVTPVLLYIMGVEFLSHILFMPIVSMSHYFTGASLTEWINLMFMIVLVVMLNIKNFNVYREKG